MDHPLLFFMGCSSPQKWSYHDKAKGTRMGLTVSMVIHYAGYKIVHLGDKGSPPTGDVATTLMNADILLLPVGDTYTLSPEEGVETALALNPGWIVPMHGAHPNIDLPLRSTSEFVNLWEGAVHPLMEKQQWMTLEGRPWGAHSSSTLGPGKLDRGQHEFSLRGQEALMHYFNVRSLLLAPAFCVSPGNFGMQKSPHVDWNWTGCGKR